jgi:hypothetical protein
MKTLTQHYLILSERVKQYVQEFSVEPWEIAHNLHHRYPPIVPFTVYTMLFSGNLKLNGFGECVLPDERTYEAEEITVVPVHFPNK